MFRSGAQGVGYYGDALRMEAVEAATATAASAEQEAAGRFEDAEVEGATEAEAKAEEEDDQEDDDDEEEVQEEDAEEDEQVPPPPPQPPQPRPASTSGGAFARCVLHVINQIPHGKTASYGQIAALAGAPRNARQVGHMLKEGLASGGIVPWFRVINSAGRISLPANGGGDTQRQRLEAEGVRFNAQTGAVAPGTFWSRATPFFE